LRIDERSRQAARMIDGLFDGALRDLVKHDPVHWLFF
jgi:hypothetical protein